MKINSPDAGAQFTYTDFQDKYQTYGVWFTLASVEHQKMNGEVKLTLRTFHMIAHSLMVNAQVLGDYIHFVFMYAADIIFPVLTIK